MSNGQWILELLSAACCGAAVGMGYPKRLILRVFLAFGAPVLITLFWLWDRGFFEPTPPGSIGFMGPMRSDVLIVIELVVNGAALLAGAAPFWLIRVVVFYVRKRTEVRFDGIHCTECGYNLTGNVTGRCPECGTEIEEMRRRGGSTISLK